MDYYLKTDSRATFIVDMAGIVDLSSWEGQYYEANNLFIDWVGQIPIGIDAEENIIYTSDQHVNVRMFNDELDIRAFTHTQSISPATPYRVFA